MLPVDFAWYARVRRERFAPGVEGPHLFVKRVREVTGYADLDVVLLAQRWEPSDQQWVEVNQWWYATVEPWCVAPGEWCGTWERRLCPRDEVLDGLGAIVTGADICNLRVQAEALERAQIATSPNPLWRAACNEELRVRTERMRASEEFAEIASMATWQQRKQVADLRRGDRIASERIADRIAVEQATQFNESLAYAKAEGLRSAAIKRGAT